MAAFDAFDTRGYRTVDVKTGYGAWVVSYETTVEDLMDLALLDRLDGPDWKAAQRVADLACGTGRTAAWLRGVGAGAGELVGVDVTPEMLAVARERALHDRLLEADARATGLETGAYDLVIASLVDEHLPDLRPLYAEAWRLAAPGAWWVLVGVHPHFVMVNEMPTHFRTEDGEDVAIQTHLHQLGEHVDAGTGAGWRLVELREAIVDDAWMARKPSWERFRAHPVSFALAWQRPA